MTEPQFEHHIEVSRSTEPVDEEPDERQVVIWLTEALNEAFDRPAEVSVQIVGEAEMSALNNEFRARPEPTNVLSFPSGIESDERWFLGDIVVCNQVVKSECERYGQSMHNRYAHMMVHGLLHLIGYDHVEEAERLEMEQLEKHLLARFDISDPYEVVESA